MRAANRCFVCGQDNPIGLKLKFSRVGEGVWAEFTPSDLHAGYEGLVHGGILAALIDDAMANVWAANGREAVTAKIEVVPPGGQAWGEAARACGARRFEGWAWDRRGDGDAG